CRQSASSARRCESLRQCKSAPRRKDLQALSAAIVHLRRLKQRSSPHQTTATFSFVLPVSRFAFGYPLDRSAHSLVSGHISLCINKPLEIFPTLTRRKRIELCWRLLVFLERSPKVIRHWNFRF